MRPGLAKIIEKVHISTYFECPETDLQIAENACCIDYTDTWSSKRVHWRSKSQRPHRSTSCYGCDDMLEHDTGVQFASIPNTGLHTQVVPIFRIHWLPATVHNTGWMDHCEIWHEGMEAIPILNPDDVYVAYSHNASRYHSLQWHVRSYWWHYASIG